MSGCTCDHYPHKDGCPYVHENPAPSGDVERLAAMLTSTTPRRGHE